MKYNNLDELILREPEAKQYFAVLPDYVKEHIRQRGNNVSSLASLQDYAENLLRGDG